MEQLTPPPSNTAIAAKNTLTMFLGLYLLILAFFILLVAISNLEEVKATAVIDSVTTTFANTITPEIDSISFTGSIGTLAAAQQFQNDVADYFVTEIQVVQIKKTVPGELMQVLLPTSTLFMPNSAQIREAQFGLLDRLVGSLSNRPRGLIHELEFLIGSSPQLGTILPTSEILETSRAGAFARQMLARGAPPDSLLIGLQRGDPEQIALIFRTRLLDETQIDPGAIDQLLPSPTTPSPGSAAPEGSLAPSPSATTSQIPGQTLNQTPGQTLGQTLGQTPGQSPQLPRLGNTGSAPEGPQSLLPPSTPAVSTNSSGAP